MADHRIHAYQGIMIPITAFLIETFTTRQLFLYAMGIFAE